MTEKEKAPQGCLTKNADISNTSNDSDHVKASSITLEILYRDNEYCRPKEYHPIVIIRNKKIYVISIPNDLSDILPPWSYLKIHEGSLVHIESPLGGAAD